MGAGVFDYGSHQLNMRLDDEDGEGVRIKGGERKGGNEGKGGKIEGGEREG